MRNISSGQDKAEFGNRNVVFCGIVRDCDLNLQRNLDRVESLRPLFNSLRIVLVENDSKDGTKKTLKRLEERDSTAIVEMNDFGTVTLPKRLESSVNPSFSHYRIEKMVRYRNRYLDLIEEKIGYDNIDWVVMLDWDVYGFSIEGFFDTLRKSGEWDVATANGRCKTGIYGDVYYDAFAYRPKGLEGPCTEESIFGGRKAVDSQLVGKNLHLVESAFNGLGIYQAKSLEGVSYRVEANDDPRVEVWCEHVVFHRDLAKRGFERVVIDPNLIVKYNTRRDSVKIFARGILSGFVKFFRTNAE